MIAYVDCSGMSVAAGEAHPNQSLGRVERWIAASLFAAAEHFTAWRLRRGTIRALSNMDDWILHDIGMSRADLPKAATGGDLRQIAELLGASDSDRNQPRARLP